MTFIPHSALSHDNVLHITWAILRGPELHVEAVPQVINIHDLPSSAKRLMCRQILPYKNRTGLMCRTPGWAHGMNSIPETFFWKLLSTTICLWGHICVISSHKINERWTEGIPTVPFLCPKLWGTITSLEQSAMQADHACPAVSWPLIARKHSLTHPTKDKAIKMPSGAFSP
jgi:hypothetical protein